jgi:hypothetical protein
MGEREGFVERATWNGVSIAFVIYVFSTFSETFKRLIDDNMVYVILIGISISLLGALIDVFTPKE